MNILTSHELSCVSDNMNCYKNHFDLLCVCRQCGIPPSHERRAPGRSQFDCWTGFLLLAAWLVSGASVLAVEHAAIHQDAERKLVTLADGQGQLVLRLNYDGRCVLDQVIVRGRQVAAESGVSDGMLVDGQWLTTRSGIPTPKVVVGKDTLAVKDIVFGKPGNEIRETWKFTVRPDRIVWRITRRYPIGASL